LVVIQPKAPIAVNKALVANRIPSCAQMRSLERSALKDQRLAISPAPIPGIGGICRARFTVPKYLGSMVGFETKPTIVSTP
jgi:hypothetical protein